MIERRIVGERGIRDVCNQNAAVAHTHLRLLDNGARDHRVQAPLGKHIQHFLLAAFLCHQQHALLRLGQHDLIRGHAGSPLRDAVELNLHADAAARAHLAGGASEPCRAHVLNA